MSASHLSAQDRQQISDLYDLLHKLKYELAKLKNRVGDLEAGKAAAEAEAEAAAEAAAERAEDAAAPTPAARTRRWLVAEQAAEQAAAKAAAAASKNPLAAGGAAQKQTFSRFQLRHRPPSNKHQSAFPPTAILKNLYTARR